ncbi:MAG: glutathione S-transferase family protein [Immundisolibacteraceae bacterium]|nr:glutathione S-transferase family protein [Immundisolibacteraceae bacterium]
MKIYQDSSAPNPRRVRIFLAEKQIEMAYEQIDLSNQQQLTEEFLAINPLGQLPVLQLDDGSYLSETMAICRYFELLQPSPVLFGKSPRQQAEVEMWNRRMEFQLLLNVAHCFQHGHPFFAASKSQSAEFAEISRQRALKSFDQVNTWLAARPFIAGDQFSVADITALCAIDFARVIDIRISESQPHLADWHHRISSRPGSSA